MMLFTSEYFVFCFPFFKCLNFKIYERVRPLMTSHDFGVKLVPLVTFHHQSLTAFSKITSQTYDSHTASHKKLNCLQKLFATV